GGDLYEDLKQRGGRFEEARTAAGVLRPCISALIYLHSKGIIHRDIKPENILLMADKSIKVADFGLSIDATSERPVTRAGTLDYMAPEVLLCPEKSRPQENKDKVLLGYTAMVDAWAMGILAYELIVGKPPFEKQSRAATYEHIMYRKPEFPANMSADAKDFVFLALTKAARKRPALASMLIHPWLALPTPVAPLPTPQLQLTMAPSSPGPSPLGLAPTECEPHTPMPMEGRQHQGVSPCTTASEETVLSCEMATPDSRTAAGGVTPQRSFQDKGQPPPIQRWTSSEKDSEDFDEGHRQTTWTASLKRGMLKMLSKGSGRDSRSTQDAAAAAVATSSNPQKFSASSQQSGDASLLPNSPPGGRAAGAGPSMNVRAINLHSKQVPSFKATSQSPSAAMLSPIASQTLSQGSPDPSLTSSKSSLVLSPAGSDAAQIRSFKPSLDLTYISDAAQLKSSKPSLDIASASETPLSRSVKPSLDLPSASGQGRSFKPSLDLTSVQGMPLTTAASLPTSGLKGNFQPSSKTAATSRLESHREAAAHSPPPTLMSQPSQLVQTVQQMLAEMQQGRQARESLGNSGRVSPRTMSVGTLAVTDASPIPEGRARQAVPGVAVRDARILNSPFAEQLASKPTANAISRRCAMGGPNMVIDGSSSNFTDYAAAQKGPQDVLRGATSHPIHPNHCTAYAYMELYGSGGQEAEAGHMQQSPPGDNHGGQLMKRSQSLALPANMALEANGQSTSIRHSFRRADLATRSSRQFPIRGTDADSGALPLLRQQKANKGALKRRITNQNIEPGSSKAAWLAQNALRDVDSPRVGSGLIKVGLGQEFEEDGRNGC
ncbi:MAG: serine threonine kinase, partial [Trebouxia sp. A1-2]